MEQQDPLILEPLLDEYKVRRRSLLPVWMKVFIWFFMFAGAIAPFCIIAGLSGTTVQLSLYGLETTDAISLTGLLILALFFFKGIVAFCLWTEKKEAVTLGIVDAVLGIVICTYLMIIAPFVDDSPGHVVNIRLELVALIPYLIKLSKIKSQWQHH